MLLLSFLERRVLNISRTCTEFLAPVSVRNRISFQCFLLPAHCLFKQHRYMNCENEAGVMQDQKVKINSEAATEGAS